MCLTAFGLLVPAQTLLGLIVVKITFATKDIMDRFEAIARKRGLTIFARIDHVAGTASVDESLRPTEIIIFGNPQGDTPFMQCAQTAGIDLPLKALAWQDAAGQVWLGYNDPDYIAKRHMAETCPSVERLAEALSGLARASTAP